MNAPVMTCDTPQAEVAQVVAQASEWWYISRRVARPVKNMIWTRPRSLPNDPIPPRANAVFEVMHLDLKQLAEVFGSAEDQPSHYTDLGGCDIDNEEKWAKLAEFTGKVIHLIYYSDQMQVGTWTELAVYHPDGRVEKKQK